MVFKPNRPPQMLAMFWGTMGPSPIKLFNFELSFGTYGASGCSRDMTDLVSKVVSIIHNEIKLQRATYFVS